MDHVDCHLSTHAPAVLTEAAAADYDGHRAAREFDAPPADPDMPFRRERVALEASV